MTDSSEGHAERQQSAFPDDIVPEAHLVEDLGCE
jgi:hypothetical protein